MRESILAKEDGYESIFGSVKTPTRNDEIQWG
jgi:hypothetical protein